MKMYTIIIVIVFLLLIPLSIISKNVLTAESQENKALRKKAYQLCSQLQQIAPTRWAKVLSDKGNKAILNKADAVLNDHIIRLEAKINKDENPLQAKWKNMAKAIVVTGVTFGIAHYYLHNKQAVRDVIDAKFASDYTDKFVSGCADKVAQHYYQAPYSSFARVISDDFCEHFFVGLPFLSNFSGNQISVWFRMLIDHLTGFTHFAAPSTTFISSLLATFNSNLGFFCTIAQNDFLCEALNGFVLYRPASYISTQFGKVWHYKSDLLKRKERDAQVRQFFNDKLQEYRVKIIS